MTMGTKGLTGLALAVVLSLGVAAQAGIFNYTDLPGIPATQVMFTGVGEVTSSLSAGAAEGALFGDGSASGGFIRSGNAALVFPRTFTASVTGGASEWKNADLQMTITAPAGQIISQITFVELGDYAITGTGASTDVKAIGTMTIEELDTTPLGSSALTGAPPVNTPVTSGSGDFTGLAFLDISGCNCSSISFSFDKTIFANSDAGTSASISNKIDQLAITVQTAEAIPTPASLLAGGVMLLGLGIARLRRR